MQKAILGIKPLSRRFIPGLHPNFVNTNSHSRILAAVDESAATFLLYGIIKSASDQLIGDRNSNMFGCQQVFGHYIRNKNMCYHIICRTFRHLS